MFGNVNSSDLVPPRTATAFERRSTRMLMSTDGGAALAELVPTKPAPKRSYDSTMTDFEAEIAAADVPEPPSPLDEALRASKALWAGLLAVSQPLGEGVRPRAEAARRLIDNHAAVLRDLTNPAPTTQLQLKRASLEEAAHADSFLREVARRLLYSRKDEARRELLGARPPPRSHPPAAPPVHSGATHCAAPSQIGSRSGSGTRSRGRRRGRRRRSTWTHGSRRTRRSGRDARQT
jgi:hypothetical protein